MAAQILDGKALASQIRAKLKQLIVTKINEGENAPGLAVILAGHDPASEVYVAHKERACKDVGIHSRIIKLEDDVTEAALLTLISELNQDEGINGILVQHPLPKHIDYDHIVEQIDPAKDVDGFHPYTVGRLVQKRPALRPCTPYGIIKLLHHYDLSTRGLNATVIGASNIVGRPLAMELMLDGATVTVCHRFTKDLQQHLANADLVAVAIGKTGVVKSEWIKPGAIVVDIGVNRLEDGSLCGDVDFDSASQKASWITPVPGGVGPMTVAMLMHNTVLAKWKESRD